MCAVFYAFDMHRIKHLQLLNVFHFLTPRLFPLSVPIIPRATVFCVCIRHVLFTAQGQLMYMYNTVYRMFLADGRTAWAIECRVT